MGETQARQRADRPATDSGLSVWGVSGPSMACEMQVMQSRDTGGGAPHVKAKGVAPALSPPHPPVVGPTSLSLALQPRLALHEMKCAPEEDTYPQTGRLPRGLIFFQSCIRGYVY